MEPLARALRVWTIAIACCFGVLWPTVGAAQSWLYVAWRPYSGLFDPLSVNLTELEVGPSGPAAVRRTVSVPGSWRAGPVITFDGGHAAWVVADSSGVERVAVFERRTGSTTLLEPALKGFTAGVRADPSAPRIFVVASDSITVLERTGRREIQIAPVFRVGPLSSDGTDLFVVHRSTVDDPATYRIAVIDPLTGTTRREFPPPDPQSAPAGLALSRDRQRLFMSHHSGTSMRLSVLDAMTGAKLASREVPAGLYPLATWSIGSVTVDDQRNRVFVDRRYDTYLLFTGSESIVLDATSLQTIGEGRGTFHVVDRVQGLVVGMEIRGSRGGFYCGGAVFETWSDAPAAMASVSVATGASSCQAPAIATPPEAPTTTTHVVSGRRVTLSWSSVPGVVDYQVEVGTETGLSNLAQLRVGATASFSVDNVPSGTYYVRVRAVNEVGAGLATTQRVVVVP